jgi:hypothetical protein
MSSSSKKSQPQAPSSQGTPTPGAGAGAALDNPRRYALSEAEIQTVQQMRNQIEGAQMFLSTFVAHIARERNLEKGAWTLTSDNRALELPPVAAGRSR